MIYIYRYEYVKVHLLLQSSTDSQCLKSTLNVSESGQIVLEKIKGVLYDVNHTKSSNLNAHCSGSVMELPLHWSLASRYMSHNRHVCIHIFNLSAYGGGI